MREYFRKIDYHIGQERYEPRRPGIISNVILFGARPMTTHTVPNTFELLKEEYVALRAEICQSINKQHQILLLGYGVVASLMGYSFKPAPATLASPDGHVLTAQVLWEVIAIVPVVLLAFGALWIVECNRMIRASYYIAYDLWPRMHKAVIDTPAEGDGWERWIRRRSGPAAEFGRTQHFMQMFVALFLPLIVSAVLYLFLFINAPVPVRMVSIATCTLASVGWIVIVFHFPKVSNLAGYSREASEIP
jgi:hypothetical protein